MWTEEERMLAAGLLKNKETMAFLKKVFCPDRSEIREQLEARTDLTDKHYGQIMRSLVLAEKHFEWCLSEINTIAAREKDGRTPIAPR